MKTITILLLAISFIDVVTAIQQCLKDKYGNIVTCLWTKKLNYDESDTRIRVKFLLKLLQKDDDIAVVIGKAGDNPESFITYASKKIDRNEGQMHFEIKKLIAGGLPSNGQLDMFLVSKNKIIQPNKMTLALNIEESDSGDGFPDRGQLQKCVEDEWGNIVTCLSVEKLQSIDLIDETIRVHFILKLLKEKHDAALVVVKTGKRLDPEFTYARKEINRCEGSVDFDIPSIMEEFEEGGEVDIHLVSNGKIMDLNQLSMTIHIGPEVPGVPSPRQILMEFYDATKGKSWKNNNGWLDDEIDVCDWYGISCYNGNIRKIKLVVNKLEGTLPESIGYISTLEHLILSDNKLKGSLPESLGDLNRLKDLSIFMNDLSGSLPESLGNLVKLKEISLFKNKLNGSLPDSLGKLTNLQALNLSGNKLTGPLPESVGGLSSMETLNLFDNKINGALPESFGKLVQLEFLYIYQNKLTGNISTTLCNGNKIEFWVDGSDISCHCCRQMGLK